MKIYVAAAGLGLLLTLTSCSGMGSVPPCGLDPLTPVSSTSQTEMGPSIDDVYGLALTEEEAAVYEGHDGVHVIQSPDGEHYWVVQDGKPLPDGLTEEYQTSTQDAMDKSQSDPGSTYSLSNSDSIYLSIHDTNTTTVVITQGFGTVPGDDWGDNKVIFMVIIPKEKVFLTYSESEAQQKAQQYVQTQPNAKDWTVTNSY